MESQSKEQAKSHLNPKNPIIETPESVSYLGVCLPKAKNADSIYVPQRKQYKDFIE